MVSTVCCARCGCIQSVLLTLEGVGGGSTGGSVLLNDVSSDSYSAWGEGEGSHGTPIITITTNAITISHVLLLS